MRVIRHSPQHITIHSPDLVLLILAVSFLGTSALMLLVFGRKVTLNCDRNLPPAGVCTLETTSFINRRQTNFSVSALQQAVVDVSYGDEDSSDTYRVVLMTTNGEVPFTGYYSSGSSGKEEIADDINRFIQSNSQQTVSVKTDDRLVLSIIAGVFGGIGALMGSLASYTTIDLDRSSGLLTVKKRSLIKNSTSEHLLSDLQKADIESSSSTYRIALRMRDDSTIPLTSYFSSGYDGKQKLADELQQFIGAARFPRVD